MANKQDGIEYFEELCKKMIGLTDITELGKDMENRTRLSKTNKGARTNARIEASQKQQPFNEKGVSQEELEAVDEDITNELLNRALEKLFGE